MSEKVAKVKGILWGTQWQHDGLFIVTGPTGSGKSTTLATMIDIINHSREGHIITIEDPKWHIQLV